MLKLTAAGLATLNILLLPLLGTSATAQPNPPSCMATLTTIQTRLETGRDLDVTIERATVTQSYASYPNGRPHSYTLILDGTAAESVMNSPQLMRSLASEAITACRSASLVRFGVANTGWSVSIGMLPSGHIDAFDCVEPDGTDRSLRWGEEYCGL